MATQETKRYLELQMQELKSVHGVNEEEQKSTQKSSKNYNSKNAEIAKLYEDAAEYEEDLKCFEAELAIVNAKQLKDIANALREEFPEEQRDYKQELRTIIETAWTHFVEVEKTHPKEQLDLIKETELSDVVKSLNAKFPDYNGDFELDLKALLVKRWETLIAIKKEHIQEELTEIKILGLKPNYVQRIYKQFHGIE